MLGFGSFKVALHDLLTVTVVLRLATYFEYPPAVISQLNTNVASSASSLMITLMEEKGLISSKDISQLLNALNKLKYYGILDKVREIFETSTGITTIKPSVKTPPKGMVISKRSMYKYLVMELPAYFLMYLNCLV